MLGIFVMVRGSLIDDAYITLAYAKNLALHLHWGLIPQEVSNTATSPLNVVLLGALTAITRVFGGVHPVLALGALSVASVMVMAWGWTRLLRVWRLPWVVGALGVAVVLVNPFLLSSIGLEVLLIPTLLILLLVTAIEERPGLFGLVAGLTLLCRLDLVVFVALIAVATPAVRRSWRRSVTITALTAAPWFVLSWFLLGSAVPDTLLIKTTQQTVWGVWTFGIGPVLYFMNRSNAVTVAFLPALVGLFALIAWLVARTAVRWETAHRLPPIGPAAALAAGGVAYYAVFSLLGVPPYHWYYVTPMISLSMFGVIAIGAWWQRAREQTRLRPAVPALALCLVALVALASLARDVKQGVPWRAPLISSNYATADAYADIGVALSGQLGGATAELQMGEIGTLAYFCDCALVEQFSDRGFVMTLIDDRIDQAGPLTRLAYKVNYLWLDRTQQPRPHQYTLRRALGPAPIPGPTVWPLESRWSGVSHLELSPAP